jgi:hypothetical protein
MGSACGSILPDAGAKTALDAHERLAATAAEILLQYAMLYQCCEESPWPYPVLPYDAIVLDFMDFEEATRVVRAAMVILAMLWWGLFDPALALQCDGKVVSMGYHRWRVREICGEPANIQDIQQLTPRRYYDPYQRIYVDTFVHVNKSIWTYNFGPSRLIYILTFENDKLVNIETDGYGS